MSRKFKKKNRIEISGLLMIQIGKKILSKEIKLEEKEILKEEIR